MKDMNEDRNEGLNEGLIGITNDCISNDDTVSCGGYIATVNEDTLFAVQKKLLHGL